MMIRRAGARDIPALHRLLAQVDLVHHQGRPDLFKIGNKYTDQELQTLLADERRPVFVAETEGTVLGYAFCVLQQYVDHNIMTDIRTLYLDDLCVDEAARGRHVGTALYAHVLDFARAQGCYNVTLNVWSCNGPALRFYQNRGLKPQKLGMEVILQRCTPPPA
ncbi:MAG: GNAT family N-acetyltransferase [Oscillospiraceae bacterium]|nr:GNAT family N-acetyltransferase [Oscillospiraceae bacterium]